MKHKEALAALWVVNIAFIVFIAYGWHSRYFEDNPLQAWLMVAVSIASCCVTPAFAGLVAEAVTRKLWAGLAACIVVIGSFTAIDSVGMDKAWDQLVEAPARKEFSATETARLADAETDLKTARAAFDAHPALADVLSKCVCPETRKGDREGWELERSTLQAALTSAREDTIAARHALDARISEHVPTVSADTVTWTSRVIQLALLLGFLGHAAVNRKVSDTGNDTQHEANIRNWERLRAEKEAKTMASELARLQTEKASLNSDLDWYRSRFKPKSGSGK